MTRACGCSGDGCCGSDAEVVQRSGGESKRPVEKSRCCQGKGDAPGAGGKFAKFGGDESRRGGSRREVKLPCGCGSEGDCFREGKLPCGCGSEGDCLHEEVKKRKLPCGCRSEGDCLVDDELEKKLACGCKAEGDCFHDERKKSPKKLDCGCKSEGDCIDEEVKKPPEKDSCGCISGNPCCHGMSGERKHRRPCCHDKKPGTLACGCKSEGDCHHEVSKQAPARRACGCQSEGDCFHEVPKQDPCSLACGCKSEGDCFHEVIKQVPRSLDCGCKSEGDCFREASRESGMRSCGGDKDETIRPSLELAGPRTDEIYRTFNIPTRFMYPKLLKGYRDKAGSLPHPCYRTTSTDYGWFSPTVHTVPTAYYPRDYAFSIERSRGGMYRNCSLNTELDKHFP